MEGKIRKAEEILKSLEKVLVAFSGGVDSSVLLKISLDSLGRNRVIAVTAVSPIHPAAEKKEAVKIAAELKATHLFIETGELKDSRFMSNLPERCFYCKEALFSMMEEIRSLRGFNAVVDGTNRDDSGDYRPGEKAGRMFGVRSPLREAGMTKEDVRRYARQSGLPCWDKPSNSCLASRIPYGQDISLERLSRIHSGEKYLYSLGFREVRLRDYGDLARIEIPSVQLRDAVSMKERIAARLKKYGYHYITLDLEGFRSGSMNNVLKGSPSLKNEKEKSSRRDERRR